MGLSPGRLRGLVQEGMPRVGRDLYPLSACVQWYVEYWRSRAIDRAADRGSNTAKDRSEEARAITLEMKAAKEQGLMVSKADVALAQDNAAIYMSKTFEGIPTALGRECNLPPEAVRKLRARLDDMRKNWARDAQAYLKEMGEAHAQSKKRA